MITVPPAVLDTLAGLYKTSASQLDYFGGGLGSPVQDQEKLHEFLRRFLQGYEREHHLSPAWLSRLDLFIAYRRILMFIVMNDWIQSDAEVHATWKQMILDQPEFVGDLRKMTVM